MNKFFMSAVTLAIGLALSSGANAANMSQNEYNVEKISIEAAYRQ